MIYGGLSEQAWALKQKVAAAYAIPIGFLDGKRLPAVIAAGELYTSAVGADAEGWVRRGTVTEVSLAPYPEGYGVGPPMNVRVRPGITTLTEKYFG